MALPRDRRAGASLGLLGAEAPIFRGAAAPSVEVRNYGCDRREVEVIRDFTWTPHGTDSLERVRSGGCSFAQRIMR